LTVIYEFLHYTLYLQLLLYDAGFSFSFSFVVGLLKFWSAHWVLRYRSRNKSCRNISKEILLRCRLINHFVEAMIYLYRLPFGC
jgi:hypothetical protein